MKTQDEIYGEIERLQALLAARVTATQRAAYAAKIEALTWVLKG